MAKVTLNDLNSLSSESAAIAAINSNNTTIENAFENTLSRDGTNPNVMSADIDLNSHTLLNIAGLAMNNTRITNLANPVAATDAVPLAFVGNAPQYAADAAASAAAALASEQAAAASETAAATSETNADASETAAAASASAASTSATNAASSASAASTSASSASSSASTASTAATNASNSASSASTSATNASNSASAASISETNAAASAAAAAISADAFDDTYLGSKASDPTLDNDGNALVEGQLYWNSVSNQLKIYTGSAWVGYSAASGLTAVVDDPAPALGGNLDLNGHTITGLVIGTDVQAFDADLSAVAGLSSNGLIARTGAGTASVRTITQPAAGITVTNGDGVSGNPTLALANDLSALEGLSSTGLAARTTTDTWAQRTITGTSNEVSVSNGDGVSGNPTISLPSTIALAAKAVTINTPSALDDSTKLATTNYVDRADRIMTQNLQTTSYTLVAADAGKQIYLAGGSGQTLTIPANASVAYTIGTVITIINNSGNNWTLAITTDTLNWAPSGGTGSRTLATKAMCTITKISSNNWFLSGVGIT